MIFIELAALWVAKKTLVLLAARAYGFKRLYRRTLEWNERFNPLGVRGKDAARRLARMSFDAALTLGRKLEGRAAGRVENVQSSMERKAADTKPTIIRSKVAAMGVRMGDRIVKRGNRKIERNKAQADEKMRRKRNKPERAKQAPSQRHFSTAAVHSQRMWALPPARSSASFATSTTRWATPPVLAATATALAARTFLSRTFSSRTISSETFSSRTWVPPHHPRSEPWRVYFSSRGSKLLLP